MDDRTGHIYDSREAAIAAGVPDGDEARADWIARVREASGALEGFANLSNSDRAAARLNELAEACRWAASRLAVEAPRPDAGSATAKFTAAGWHAGQMALYRRLETLAKNEEFRGVHRDAGLITELRFKAEMHEQAARALSRPELPEPATPAPADDDAAETCETCRAPITGRVVWSWDDVPLCEACAEPEAPIPGDGRCRRCRHYHLLGEVCGAPQCDCDLRVIKEGLLTAENVRGILPAPTEDK